MRKLLRLNFYKGFFGKFLSVIGCFLFSLTAFANDVGTGTSSTSNMDLSKLTDAVDFSYVLNALMTVSGTLVALYAGWAGIRWILKMVKSA